MLEYKDMRKKKPLPMIYPLILYHGDTKFKYALDFLDLVDGSKEEIDKYLRGNLQLIDLNTTTDEELLDKSEVLMSLPLLCLKHIKDKNMLDFLTRNKKHAKRLLSLFRQYIETVGMENMTSVLRYVYTAGKIDNEDEFVQFLNDIKPKLEKNMMTLREAAVQEGREEGIEQGMGARYRARHGTWGNPSYPKNVNQWHARDCCQIAGLACRKSQADCNKFDRNSVNRPDFRTMLNLSWRKKS